MFSYHSALNCTLNWTCGMFSSKIKGDLLLKTISLYSITCSIFRPEYVVCTCALNERGFPYCIRHVYVSFVNFVRSFRYVLYDYCLSRAVTLFICLPLSATWVCILNSDSLVLECILSVASTATRLLVSLLLTLLSTWYYLFFSSSTTKQKVYMARFWLPLYTAVVISMYAYGILLNNKALEACYDAKLHHSFILA